MCDELIFNDELEVKSDKLTVEVSTKLIAGIGCQMVHLVKMMKYPSSLRRCCRTVAGEGTDNPAIYCDYHIETLTYEGVKPFLDMRELTLYEATGGRRRDPIYIKGTDD